MTRHSPHLSTEQLGTWLTITAVAWGAVAFGAVYTWGYGALAIMAVGAGSIGSFTDVTRSQAADGSFERPAISRGLLFALGSIGGVAAVQLIPLPLRALTLLNPDAITIIQRFDPVFALNPGPHALSVWPPHTIRALVLFGSFAALMVGTTRLLSAVGARRFVELLIVTGVSLALVGIIQRPLSSGKIYGFWEPRGGGSPFGPFVNKNHFAGWTVMMLGVALGYLCAGLARVMRGVQPEWRSRLLWLSSPDANKLIMVATAAAIMGLAVALTLSRSGISALALALAVMTWFAVRRLQGRSSKGLAAAYFLLVAAAIVAWTGVDILVNRFSVADWEGFNGRGGAAADALATFRRHWLTGTGLNTYQVANLFYQQHGKEAFVSSAHNDYLQIAAEGGILLSGAVAGCIALFIRDVRRRFAEDSGSSAYWLRAGAVTALVAIALQETAEFSLQIPGNAVLFAVVCAIALHRSPRRIAVR